MPAVVASPTDFESRPRSIPQLKAFLSTAVMVAVLSAAYAGYAWWCTGSASMVLPYMQGQRVFFDPLTMVLADAPARTVIKREVNVKNLGSSEVRLIGAKASCGCLTLSDFPVNIPAGGTHPLEIKMATAEKAEGFEHAIQFFVDNNGYQKVVVNVEGHVGQ